MVFAVLQTFKPSFGLLIYEPVGFDHFWAQELWILLWWWGRGGSSKCELLFLGNDRKNKDLEGCCEWLCADKNSWNPHTRFLRGKVHMLQQRSFNTKSMQFTGISNIVVAVCFGLTLKWWKQTNKGFYSYSF